MIQQVSNYALQNSLNTTSTASISRKWNDFDNLLQNAASKQNKTMDDMFAQAASTYNVPENLLKAIGYHESRFQPEVVSSAGAMGIMQLMPTTAQSMGVADPFDAEQNIMGGAKLLGQLIEKYDGDLKLTLAAYGAGSGAVAKYNGVPPYEETQNFVKDIMSALGNETAIPQTPQLPKASYPQASSATAGLQATNPFQFTAPSAGVSATGSEIYQKLMSQINSYQDYTMEDYRIFLNMILKEAQEQTESETGLPDFVPFFL